MADEPSATLGERNTETTELSEATSLLDLLLTIARYKTLIVAGPISITVLALVVSFVLPNWYTGTTRIMPPQQTQSNAVAILGQLGALAAGSAGQALGIKNPSDIFIAMLKSRTVADRLIQRFDLKTIYGEDYLIEARKELARNSTLTAGREGVITIEVEDKDPKRAAELAKGYVDELRTLTLSLAIGEASQRRLFFEGQVRKAKDDLVRAESELERFTQASGLVSPQGQISLTVAAAAALRAQITAKDVQMAAMHAYATESNPEIQRINREVAGLRAELEKMEKNPTLGKGDVLVPFGKAPEVGLQYIRRFRDMKYYETLFEVLSRQYEIARIDESKDATLIQVLDDAVVPEKRTRPKRLLIAIVSGIVSFVLSMLIAFWHQSWSRTKNSTGGITRLMRLRKYVTEPWSIRIR